jgi:hypothetical protein
MVLWRPSVWVAKGAPGTCSDETGQHWAPCQGQSPGHYRIQVPVVPAPPPLNLPPRPEPLNVPAPPSLIIASRPRPVYFDSPQAAMAHMPDPPPDCRADSSKAACAPTFALQMDSAGKVFWRFAGWRPVDPPGACVDATGHDWSSCGAPPAGRYRLHIPAPPKPIVAPESPAAPQPAPR